MDSSDTTDEPKKTYDQKTFFKIVGSFAVAETLVWAAYYYSFAAFFPTWEAELKFSKPVLTGAFTMALIVAAFAAPLVGRLIDFGHGKVYFLVVRWWQACSYFYCPKLPKSGSFTLFGSGLAWRCRAHYTKHVLL